MATSQAPKRRGAQVRDLEDAPPVPEARAIAAFSALSQQSRLRMVRLLVQAGPEGMAAGALADAVGASPSNVSFHLKELERAGLVGAKRAARSIVYRADYAALLGLIRFLMEDCCAARREICAPIIANPCCAPIVAKRPARAAM